MHTVVDMSVIYRIIGSIRNDFPVYRLFADNFKKPADKQALFASLAESALSYLEFLFTPKATIHLVLERQTGGKVTTDARAKARAAATNKGLGFIYMSGIHGHMSIGKELISKSSSLTQYDQAMIANEMQRQRPGILYSFKLTIS